MTTHGPEFFAFDCVLKLQLHFTLVGTHRQASAKLGPGYRRDSDFAVLHFAQLGHLGGTSAREIDAPAKPYRENVVRGPSDQIQIEIVLPGGSIEDFEWHFENVMLLFVECRIQQVCRVWTPQADRGVGLRWIGGGGTTGSVTAARRDSQ